MIAVFSGTGNSMRVARQFSRILGDELLEMPVCLPIPGQERVIWVFPVYSWGVPPVVLKAIRQTPSVAGAPAYMVCTCGDDVGLTDRIWAKAVEARGFRPMGAFSVQMPNTYVLMKGFDVDSDELATKKVEESSARIETIAAAISESTLTGKSCTDDMVRGSFPWIKSRIIYPWFKRYAMSPEPFFADERCVGCEKCVRYCPLENISMDPATDRPLWGSNCALCLRCYHICPTHAVCYSTATRGKGQWQGCLSELNPKTHGSH